MSTATPISTKVISDSASEANIELNGNHYGEGIELVQVPFEKGGLKGTSTALGATV
jgi:hypothetical protein